MPKKNKVLASAILVMVLWGSLFPMIKIGYKAFGIDTSVESNLLMFAGIRFVICGCIITAVSALKKNKMVIENKQELFKMLAVGLFAIVLHYTCTYIGLARADSSVTALLKQLGSFVFIPLSFLFFKDDSFSVYKTMGAVLGFGGIIVLSFDGYKFVIGEGELLIIAASLCSVVSNIFGKSVMRTMNALTLTGYSQFTGGIILILIAFISGGRITHVSITAVLVFTYICFASIFGYCIWNDLVSKNNLSNLLIIKFIEPVMAALFGALLLGEDIFNLRFLFAFIMTFTAIVFSNKKPKTIQ